MNKEKQILAFPIRFSVSLLFKYVYVVKYVVYSYSTFNRRICISKKKKSNRKTEAVAGKQATKNNNYYKTF